MTALLFRRSIYRTPDELRQRYRHLYDAEVEATADGARFERARLFRRSGINVLFVTGDRFEMAFQHGRLLADEIKETGTLRQTGLIAKNAIENSLGRGPLAQAVQWFARWGIAEPMLRRGARRAKQNGEASLSEGYGLAEGSGLPVRTIFEAPLGPEVAQTLLGRVSGIAVGADPLACTSFTAWGSKTETGEVIIGRNTDYPLTGFYDRHPTVIYAHPTDGAKKYMCVTSAGLHNATTGGMNDSGMYLACHTVPAKTVSERGLPVLMVGQTVLREASTLDEAEAIIREAKPAAGWNFHVVSVQERRAATFEMCAKSVTRLDGEGEVHCSTNHYRSPQMEPHGLFVNHTVDTDTRSRLKRCEEMIDAAPLSLRGAAAILGDKFDRTVGRIRSGPNCVSASTTVSSSVWMPESGQVFVANGPAPASQSTYVEVPTLDRFDPESFGGAHSTFENSRVRDVAPQMLEAEQIYQRAREAFEYHDDSERAVELMQAALAVDSDNPGLWLHLALYAIRAQQLDVARDAVEEIVARQWDPTRVAVGRYVRGRLSAHAGEPASEDLEWVAARAEDPRLRAAAERTLKRLRRSARVQLRPREIAPMSWMPDAFRY